MTVTHQVESYVQLTQNLIFWAGTQSLFPHAKLSTRLFSAADDFREAAFQHGVYHSVYLQEYDLAKFKQWPLILDEALRLFRYGARGTLVVQFSKSNLMSQFAFAAFLRRRKDFVFELLDQMITPNGMYYYEISCLRETFQPTLSSFEFAIITDGRKPDAVNRFIASVMAMTGIEHIDWSIAICGPRDIEQSVIHQTNRLRFIEQSDQHTEKGWITHKKNLIVQSSQAENLLIAHDRYELPATFLNRMLDFGSDFSVLAPAQRDAQGHRYPDWLATNEQWQCTVSGQLQYGDYSPHLYVNGGVIISKRRVLLETPWNTLLFWDQNEDIELTRRMTDAGITPRLARHVELIVTQARAGLLYDFVSRLPFDPNHYVTAHCGIDPTQLECGAFEVGETLNLCASDPMQLAKRGLVAATTDWGFQPDGLVLQQTSASLAIDIGLYMQRQLQLYLYGKQKIDAIMVNGVALEIKQHDEDNGSWRIQLDLEPILKQHSRFIVLNITGVEGMILTALGLTHAAVELNYPLSVQHGLPAVLRTGWAHPESWGVWSVDSKAILHLPVPVLNDARSGVTFEFTLIAFSGVQNEKKWVGIACDSVPIALIHVPCKKPARVRVCIPRALFQHTRTLKLSLTSIAPASPAEFGLSLDNRKLGVGLIAIDAK